MIVVYQKLDDPYLSEILVSIVTKMGYYLNGSQAEHLIGQGKVSVDGTVVKNQATILRPGIKEFVVNDKKIVVEIREMEAL